MKTDHKFKPRNEKENAIVSAVENAAEILCDVLNVDITLRIERMNGWAWADAFHAGKWIASRRMVKINMRNLYGVSLDTILIVLGHEFRHAVQTIHGVCDDIADDRSYPGYRVSKSYWNDPEEKDARKYERAYAAIATGHELFRYKEHLENVVPGEPIRIPDRSASLAQLGVPVNFVAIFRDKDDRLYWFDLRRVAENPKRWTKSVYQKVWSLHREQLLSQPFQEVYREATLADLVS